MLEDEKKPSITEKSVEDGDQIYGSRPANDKHHLDATDLDHVQRKLKQRHVQMIAIAGTIGTGLFLGSGGALAGAGPLGALLAYMLVGTVAYSTLCAVGELTTWAPVSGTFPHFAARWVDPALGFAVGWNYFYTNAVSTPTEISAAVVLLSFWDTNLKHVPAYTIVLIVLICSINVFGVKYFGEAEFYFSLIKIALILGLLLAGLIVDLGGGPNHNRTGFRYWKNPGALNRAGLVSNINTDRFLAFLGVIVQASFSYQGVELVAIAASETENPRRNISKAVRRVFYRIAVFYICGILMIGMLVAYNNENLLHSSGTAAQSPFVIAFNTAGVKVFPHIINACVFTSAFSAGNSFLFCGSRILYGLAVRGQAPKIFAYCTKGGLPIIAVLASSLFSFLAFLSVSSGGSTAFNWLVSLGTTGGFFGWFSINLTYIRWRQGMLAQGFDLKSNVYNNRFQPFISYWGCFWNIIFILINGFKVFFQWNVTDFLTSYINIPIFVGLYLFWKIWKRTSFWSVHEMDLTTGIPTLEETDAPEEPAKNVWEWMANTLF
ncbi:hypothetical protein AX14_009689 [Amanita brunnescens Koide BX004]|nr:hypothetical protein AX14_009689 [Amanita brunnescens Koide BX004]